MKMEMRNIELVYLKKYAHTYIVKIIKTLKSCHWYTHKLHDLNILKINIRNYPISEWKTNLKIELKLCLVGIIS